MTTRTDTILERLDAITAQLDALESHPPAPATQLVDPYGNPAMVAAGDLIEAAWGNAVAGRVAHRFPTSAALFATSGYGDGSVAYTTDRGVVWVRAGGLWRPTAVGNVIRFRGAAPPAGQSKNGLDGAATWVMDDPFAVTSGGTTFTVPAGWAGMWSFDWAVEYPAAGDGTRQAYGLVPGSVPVRFAQFNIQTTYDAFGIPTAFAGSATVKLTEGQTVQVIMAHTPDSALITVNATGQQYFQGRYVGPG
jgi:hypothetical protein